MAKTSGHGNPNWTRDETILALHLYLVSLPRVPGPADVDVKALSDLLRSLPYHEEAARVPSFRNPDGVAFKLQNIRQVATGKGLGNVSRTDRSIWEEFGDKPEEVASLAAAIRAGIAAVEEIPEPLEEEFNEGRLLTMIHVRRERDPKIRKRLLDSRHVGLLSCDACKMQRPEFPLELQEALFEAHHLLALSDGTRVTRLADLALLCACCHRLVHKLMSTKKRAISIVELAALVAP